jgi:hypothetical protein
MLLVCHIVACFMLSSTHHCHSPLVLILFHHIISCYSYCITCITMKYYPLVTLCKWWTSTIIKKNKEKNNEFFHSFFFNLSFLPFFSFGFFFNLFHLYFYFFKRVFCWLFYNNFVVLLKEFSKKFNINNNTFNFYLYVFAKQIGKTI